MFGRLQPTATAATVRCWPGGDVMVARGPVADAKERSLLPSTRKQDDGIVRQVRKPARFRYDNAVDRSGGAEQPSRRMRGSSDALAVIFHQYVRFGTVRHLSVRFARRAEIDLTDGEPALAQDRAVEVDVSDGAVRAQIADVCSALLPGRCLVDSALGW